MHAYRVLGGVLRSDLDFPELPADTLGRPATWTLTTCAGSAPHSTFERLGADPVRSAGEVTLDRGPAQYRLTYPDTGVYDITDEGSRIDWYPPAERPYDPERFLDAARIDVLGRVLAVAMHAGGTESLHGSAVALADGRAVAFVAPKFHGKSTLASALVAQGARLLTDDTLPVEQGDPPHARPGVHTVRMWEDSAGRLSERLPGLEPGPWGKLQASHLPGERLAEASLPLAAIYVLAPVRADGGAAPAREQLAPVVAAVSLVAHAKLGPLLGRDEAARLLAWAVRLAGCVPVFRLLVPRSYDQLPAVVARLREWHRA